MKKIKLNNGIFPREGWFVYGSDKQAIIKWVNSVTKYNFDVDTLSNSGCCFTGNGKYIIHMHKFPTTPASRGVLAHEILHAVCYVCDFVGVRLSQDSEETFAYLTSHLTEQIYDSKTTNRRNKK